MRILHTIDVMHRGGIGELILRFGKNSRHKHDVWSYRGTLSDATDAVGIITWTGGPPPEEQYDVLMAHTVGGWSHKDVFLWAKARGMKTVELIHSVHVSPTPPELCDQFVAVSSMAENANTHFPKHMHIYSYFEVPSFQWWDRQSSRDYIGRLSRLADEKRPHDFMDIAACFPNQKFLIAGDGKLYDYINQKKTPNLEMVGWITDLPSFYDRLKLFVFPTRDECFCYSVAYAQAAGVPIICQDIPQLRESTGGHAWFANTAGEFVSLISKYLADPYSYSLDMTHAARSWIWQTSNNIHLWDDMLENL